MNESNTDSQKPDTGKWRHKDCVGERLEKAFPHICGLSFCYLGHPGPGISWSLLHSSDQVCVGSGEPYVF